MVELNEKALEAAHHAYQTHEQMGDLKALRLSDSCLTAVITAYLAALPAPDDGLEVVGYAYRGPRGGLLVTEEPWKHAPEAVPLVNLSDAQTALQSKDEQIERLTRENTELQAARNENAKLRGQRDASLAHTKSLEQQVQKLTAEVERPRKALLAIATGGLAASDAAYVAAVALETEDRK